MSHSMYEKMVKKQIYAVNENFIIYIYFFYFHGIISVWIHSIQT